MAAVGRAGSRSGSKNPRERDRNVTFYQTRAEAERARNAWHATQYLEGGYRSFTAFVAGAVTRETARLARRFNGGRAFPALKPGTIKPGRRPGSQGNMTPLEQQTFSQRPTDNDKARGAWAATQHLIDGYESFALMIATSVSREARLLEQQHNAGEPFPPLQSELKPGRRPGQARHTGSK